MAYVVVGLFLAYSFLAYSFLAYSWLIFFGFFLMLIHGRSLSLAQNLSITFSVFVQRMAGCNRG